MRTNGHPGGLGAVPSFVPSGQGVLGPTFPVQSPQKDAVSTLYPTCFCLQSCHWIVLSRCFYCLFLFIFQVSKCYPDLFKRERSIAEPEATLQPRCPVLPEATTHGVCAWCVCTVCVASVRCVCGVHLQCVCACALCACAACVCGRVSYRGVPPCSVSLHLHTARALCCTLLRCNIYKRIHTIVRETCSCNSSCSV